MKYKFLLFFLMTGMHVFTQTISVKQYIDSFKRVAMIEMKLHKIPASITLAQGLLESGSGNSRLAKEGNNHFGIKCKKEWTGCTIMEDDDALQECFRCYTKAEDSYRDHSKFLLGNKRYAALFELEIIDYRSWAKGLLDAGYATNRKYADLLITTIERNRLFQYDSLVMAGYDPYQKPEQGEIPISNGEIPSVVVQNNQDLNEIAELYDKPVKKISKFNDLAYHNQIQPGDVYLKPKKKKASVTSHRVIQGETMWGISQKYAIRINSLYKKNLMVPGTEAKTGEILQLREKAIQRPDTGRNEENRALLQKDLTGTIHTVARGETLFGIARMYGVDVSAIKSRNNLSADRISEGQILHIPVTESQNSKILIHEVGPGETLFSISRKYNTSVENLKIWNKLNGESIFIGQNLEIRLR